MWREDYLSWHLNSWMKSRLSINEEFMKFLLNNSSLTKRGKILELELPNEIDSNINEYLLEGELKDNHYFSDISPINSMGRYSTHILEN